MSGLSDNRRAAANWMRYALAALVVNGLTVAAANAYTAAGDRNFPATLVLPQIAPSDAFWITPSTQPTVGGQQTTVSGTYSKLITERLGIQIESGFIHRGAFNGAQNLNVQLQYEPVLDRDHEFLMSFQVSQDIGGTGSSNVGSFAQSATQPGFTFGKGFGGLPIASLRPLAITGFAGYQVANGQGVRPNMFNAGLSLQYSFPYLVSKVSNYSLPSLLSGMTPMVEVFLSTPVGRRYQTSETLVIAPGVNYSQGNGWETGIEALIPTNRATGTGWGIIARVVIQLDYLLPDSILGRPLIPSR